MRQIISILAYKQLQGKVCGHLSDRKNHKSLPWGNFAS